MNHSDNLSKVSSQVRRDILRMVNAAGSGHPGGSMGIADVMTALFFKVMKHDPSTWSRNASGQDAFILSAGHLAPVYYSVLARSGYFDKSLLGTLRQYGSLLQGHPSVGIPGVFQASGSLGQGLSAAAGIALGKKMSGDGNKVYVLCGDGETEEGQIWEAAIWAAHHHIDNLIAFTDWNGKQIDGPVDEVAGLGNLRQQWEAFGWETTVADGHDFDSILNAFATADNADGRPKMILFRTEMGHGVDFMAGTHKWHGKAPDADQLKAALEQIPETLGDYDKPTSSELI